MWPIIFAIAFALFSLAVIFLASRLKKFAVTGRLISLVTKAPNADDKTAIADDETAIADDKTAIADDEAPNADDEAPNADDKAPIADDKTAIADDYKKISGKFAFVISLVLVIVILVILSLIFGFINAVVIAFHLAAAFCITDGIAWIVRRCTHSKIRRKLYISGYIAVILTVIYLGFAYYNAVHVSQTVYQLETDKIDGPLRIALISDSHIGATFDGEGFCEELKKIQETEPDVLFIAGDFVDDGTSDEDLEIACEGLRDFKCTYGIFFAHGNHDRGYFRYQRDTLPDESTAVYDDNVSAWSRKLAEKLEENGVTVLQDETSFVGDVAYVVGRKDAGNETRLPIDELTSGLDKDRYIIVLDHQPTDYESEAASGADLVLSGHTHGGQLFPINYLSTIISDNYQVYGLTHLDKTDFIVSSGISDWEILFKTACRSEYVIIDVNAQ